MAMRKVVKLLDRSGQPHAFSEAEIAGEPEAILMADRVFLPTKQKDEHGERMWKEANFYLVSLPPVKSLAGW